MQNRSKIIIVGAGITGASAAYHLAKLGWKDITVLDQGPLFETGGSTTHAPGGVFQTNPSRMMCKFAQYTVKLLSSLEYEGKPCYHPVGGIEVSKTKERHQDLYRKMGLAHSYGLTEAKIISPEEVQKMSPYIDPSKIHGGYYVPNDGLAAPVRAVQAMAKYVTDKKAGTFIGDTAVTGFKIVNNQIKGVETEKGIYESDIVLADPTTVSNIGIILGALIGSALSGKITKFTSVNKKLVLAAVIGGLFMGYGARLAFGCNIGALFGGIASGSLHGWVWFLFAFLGSIVGVKFRKYFY
ncbi:FAD-dependent oxidoreductase [Pelagibacteraceae bacterium]|nr:FAD-dependent oxidoreductase [Pelagibacteraceae bacterium]